MHSRKNFNAGAVDHYGSKTNHRAYRREARGSDVVFKVFHGHLTKKISGVISSFSLLSL